MSIVRLKRMIPPIVALAIFMESVDISIINTAIPSMARSLHVNVINLKVALISYLLSLAIFIPISGWLADRFGTRNIFMGAIAIFTISSAACGFSKDLFELVLARFFQGMGGALMIPVGRLIIVRLFDRSELISAMNRVIVPALIGPALGPFLGGIISQNFSWPWIFWVNIPFGVLNLVLAYYWIQNVKLEKNPPFDGWGFVLFGLGLAGLVFGFSALTESGISPALIYAVFSLSVLLLISYVYYSTQVEHPVLKISLLSTRTLRISVLGNLFSRLGFGGIPFLLPLFLQIPLGYSPTIAGLCVALTAIGAMLIKVVSKNLARRFGFKRLLLMNTFLIGFDLWLFMLVHPGTPLFLIGIFTLFLGILLSLQFSSMNPMAYADIPSEDTGAVTSIMSMMQQVAMSFGVAITALVLKHFVIFGAEPRVLSLSDFHHTFFILGLLTILSSTVFLRLKKEDGQNLIHE